MLDEDENKCKRYDTKVSSSINEILHKNSDQRNQIAMEFSKIPLPSYSLIKFPLTVQSFSKIGQN